jgi:hypothetical protein
MELPDMTRTEKMALTYQSGGVTWYRQWSIDAETGRSRCAQDALPASELDAAAITALENAFQDALATLQAVEEFEDARRLVATAQPSGGAALTAWNAATTLIAGVDNDVVALADKRAEGDV